MTDRLRDAATALLDALDAVRAANQSEGAGGGSWIHRAATREHQQRVARTYAEMHKAKEDLRSVLAEPADERVRSMLVYYHFIPT
ncbi:hypothetical protein UFOVP435_50 [uncultured Caudovirales phage]|uniref:Uncharacterized protein n=1 Tax=uncultured Caudovirales phage TaxID=2100421 RepID=A0A6J5MH69_9CAUD|nr:hypothetical protein UFOVP435_50 [uncultured Caudovirales phage]